MSLPTHDEIEKVLAQRPGDDLYKDVKPRVDEVGRMEKVFRGKIADLLLGDMSIDMATANCLDDTGKVLEYLAQEHQVEPPQFSGEALMKDFGRMSKLSLSMKYAKLIGLEGEVLDCVMKAEVERLWGGSGSTALKKALQAKGVPHKMQTYESDVHSGVKPKQKD
jgi:hypothetical protein